MAQRRAIAKFDLNKLRYYDDKKFPFRLLVDIPKLMKHTLDKIKESSFNQSKIGLRSVGMMEELQRFLDNNESGFANMVVYLFWITMSFMFTDTGHISFPKAFI